MQGTVVITQSLIKILEYFLNCNWPENVAEHLKYNAILRPKIQPIE